MELVVKAVEESFHTKSTLTVRHMIMVFETWRRKMFLYRFSPLTLEQASGKLTAESKLMHLFLMLLRNLERNKCLVANGAWVLRPCTMNILLVTTQETSGIKGGIASLAHVLLCIHISTRREFGTNIVLMMTPIIKTL